MSALLCVRLPFYSFVWSTERELQAAKKFHRKFIKTKDRRKAEVRNKEKLVNISLTLLKFLKSNTRKKITAAIKWQHNQQLQQRLKTNVAIYLNTLEMYSLIAHLFLLKLMLVCFTVQNFITLFPFELQNERRQKGQSMSDVTPNYCWYGVIFTTNTLKPTNQFLPKCQKFSFEFA